MLLHLKTWCSNLTNEANSRGDTTVDGTIAANQRNKRKRANINEMKIAENSRVTQKYDPGKPDA